MSLFKYEVDLEGDTEVAQLKRAEPLPWHTVMTDQGDLIVTKCHYAYKSSDVRRKTFDEVEATSAETFCERCSPYARKKRGRYSGTWSDGASE
jgi:hypothetical protein